MPQDSEHSQAKRRFKADMVGQDALPLPTYPRATARRVTTDAYSIEESSLEPPRSTTSAIRLDGLQATQARTTGAQSHPTSVPVRRQQGVSRQLTSPQPGRQTGTVVSGSGYETPPKRFHWLVPAGIGMMAMVVLWMLGATAVAWGTQRYYDIRYGSPRTFQTDAVVGHGGDNANHPSHFIAINLNRQVVIVELKAGDPAQARSYTSNYITGDGGDLVPVTLEFRDVTGDGRKDMLIHLHLASQDQVVVFVNDGDTFRPATPNDKIHL